MTDGDRRSSDNLVTLVRGVYGLVIVSSLLIYRDVVTDPLDENYVATAALVLVYVTTILSWIDWHGSMERFPYRVSRQHDPHPLAEEFRLGFDLLIAGAYVYMLFSLEDFRGHPTASIEGYLLGLPVIFALYFLSGRARATTHGGQATWPVQLLAFLVVYAVVDLVYGVFVAPHWIGLVTVGTLRISLGNLVTLAACLVLMVTYRAVVRVRLRRSRA